MEPTGGTPETPTTTAEDAVAGAAPEPAPATGAAAVEAETAAPPVEPAPTQTDVDLGRRRFFRQFAGELIQSAATVAGAASAIQRASAEAAAGILDPTQGAASLSAVLEPNPGLPATPTGFRTPFREDDGVLYMIDQRQLPDRLVEVANRSAAEVAYSIRQMIVRGAPAIGQVAAIGLALTAEKIRETRPYARRATLRGASNALIQSRPTAVNLRWAVDRLMARYEAIGDLKDAGDEIAAAMRAEADAIVLEATTDHGRLATFGLGALPGAVTDEVRILTHCNTGPLACGQYGTALGVVQAAHHAGRAVHVWVDETRPYLQGARLTAWELAQAGVPHTLLPDVAAASLMAEGKVDVILVGADRVAANGDTANKVGTYMLAVLAARHGVPFYVCAPTSSIDLETPDGAAIPIEERAAEEVLQVRGVSIAPADTQVFNPSFDVTPAELITGIITEEGIVTSPFEPGLTKAVADAVARWAAIPGHDRPTRVVPETPPLTPSAG